ncbi:MAG: hypothetical protein WAK07_09670, partial [Rhodomicrobium sp.]
ATEKAFYTTISGELYWHTFYGGMVILFGVLIVIGTKTGWNAMNRLGKNISLSAIFGVGSWLSAISMREAGGKPELPLYFGISCFFICLFFLLYRSQNT